MKKIIKKIITGIIIVILTIILTFILREHFFRFDKKLNNDHKKIIEQYISNLNQSNLSENMTFLSTYYFGDRYNNDKIEVYLWVMYDEYIANNNLFEQYQSFSNPYVITIDVANDQFKIINYKVPDDGNLYRSSINKMFPLAIRGKVNNFHNSHNYDKLLKEHEELIDTYQKYYLGDE